jgi:hypothetical protein
MARAGTGVAEFVGDNERIEPKVMNLLKASLSERFDSPTFEWTNLKDKNKQPMIFPYNLSINLTKDLVIYSWFFEDVELPKDLVGKLTINDEKSIEVKINFEEEELKNENIIHLITARNAIRGLQENNTPLKNENEIKKTIIEISIDNNIVILNFN